MKNELYHFGTPGMKWGVRNFQAKDGTWTEEGLQRRRLSGYDRQEQTGYRNYKVSKGDTVIPKGTNMYRIANGSNANFTKGVYVSYKSSDRDLYKGVLGRMRVSKPLSSKDTPQVKEVIMKTKQEIRLPSKQQQLASFKAVYDANPKQVLKLITEHEREKKRMGDDEQEKSFDSSDRTSLWNAYKKFNDALSLGDRSANYEAIKAYYHDLSKKGYNAIPDENDIRLSTFKSRAPIILFDSDKSISKTTYKDLTPSEILYAYRRSIVPKLVRQMVLPRGVGFADLKVDSIKLTAKYNEMIQKDITRLSKSYTMQNLSDDWGRSRLSAHQIDKVSKYMDQGYTHEEAVNKVIHYGNTILNQILKKYEV